MTGSKLSQKRILLVDDDAEVRSLIRALLEGSGYSVFSCGDGRRAQELFQSRSDIDLLLTDLQMPGIDGFDLARDLTRLRPALPVFVISGVAMTEFMQKTLAENGWHFMHKPLRIPALLGAIHNLLDDNLLDGNLRDNGDRLRTPARSAMSVS